MLRPAAITLTSITAAAMMLVAGCSGDKAPLASGGAAAAAGAAQPSAASSAGTSAAGKAAAVPVAPRSSLAPKFSACRRLDRSAAAAALGESVSAGTEDRRLDLNGRAQVDGCVYEGTDGARVSYLAWWSPKLATTADVRRGLAPAGTGATLFTPDVGTRAAGSQLSRPRSVQVNAAKGRLLVQVTISGVAGSRARPAAIAAARTAVTPR